jgi:hypothetical protein
MRVTAYIPDDLGLLLKETAHNESLSISALTAKALDEYLERRRKKASGYRLLNLIHPESAAPDALKELERARSDVWD